VDSRSRIRAVERQIANRDFGELELLWRQPDLSLAKHLLMEVDDRLPTKYPTLYGLTLISYRGPVTTPGTLPLMPHQRG
jgi:hypothetical protein